MLTTNRFKRVWIAAFQIVQIGHHIGEATIKKHHFHD